MERIVECVPNFSEGRDKAVIEKICEAIKSVEDVKLLDVDPGEATNRTVVTIAGNPKSVIEAAFRGIKKASELIDMSKHKGAHARMGATDVCPFIPVSGVDMDDCVLMAKELGKRVGEELNIPVYLYAQAAQKPERKRLPDIREGEYEALEQKLKDENFKPDFGEAKFNAKAGATAIGARDFLIAYNININSRDKKLASKIANRVREKGRRVKDKVTKKMKTIPGTCKHVQGMGWYIEEYNRAQITVNILNYHETPIYKVFEDCRKFADEFGVRITGSELVGLVPLECLLNAGDYYLRKQNGTTGVSERDKITTAIQSLGLEDITPFNPDERIIEYKLKKPGRLVSMTLCEFADELASDSPAPGGGSIAALNGVLAAGLSTMVGNLTYNKKAYKEHRDTMIELSHNGQKLKDFFIKAIDDDTNAFNLIMDAFSLPKSNEEEIELRNKAIEDATKEAVRIPFSVLEKSLDAVNMALTAAEKGNQNSLSDAGVASLCASLSAEGACYNVLINLQDIKDDDFIKEYKSKAIKLNQEIQDKAEKIKTLIREKLGYNN